jgi:hypothetical protein
VERLKWHKEEKQCSGEDTNEHKSKQKVYEDDNNDMFSTHSTDPPGEPLSKEENNVWELIPDSKKRCIHTRKKLLNFFRKTLLVSWNHPSSKKDLKQVLDVSYHMLLE